MGLEVAWQLGTRRLILEVDSEAITFLLITKSWQQQRFHRERCTGFDAVGLFSGQKAHGPSLGNRLILSPGPPLGDPQVKERDYGISQRRLHRPKAEQSHSLRFKQGTENPSFLTSLLSSLRASLLSPIAGQRRPSPPE
ncbi:hypothetical protein CRG98_032147, partial [Punica granatum]